MNLTIMLIISALVYSFLLIVLLFMLVRKPKKAPVRKKVKSDLHKIKEQINGE